MFAKNHKEQGFSLIQISVLIAVAGIILASTLPGGKLGSEVEKERITTEKMEKIEAATQSFMASKLRRPCPADGTLATTNANFGKEDTTSGRCSNSNFYTQATPLTKTGTTSTTAATITGMSDTNSLSIGMLVTGTNLADDTHIASIDSSTQITLNKYATTSGADTLTFTAVAAGVVPVRSLGLPDDYMFDGYGRRIGYMVDIRATDQTTCRDMQTTKSYGAINIVDKAEPDSVDDSVMWSLISYGKNGHGAFSMQGSSIANRINSGSTSTKERNNAFVDAAFATTFNSQLVKQAPNLTAGSNYYDDTIWYQESTKNTCCVGKVCSMGTRIDGEAGEFLGTSVATGDINGDGVKDMVFFAPNVNKIRVVFGAANGWPLSSGMQMSTANKSRFITLTNDTPHPNFAYAHNSSSSQTRGYGVAVGDINGDGYDDIAMSYGDATSSAIKVFYGSASPVDTNISTITNIITLPPATGSTAPAIVLGNFANTNKKDILTLVNASTAAGGTRAYLLYGASSYSLTAEAVTTIAASVGFKIALSTPRGIFGIWNKGDLNNDGYEDLTLSNWSSAAGGRAVYVVFGQSPANWNTDKSVAATGSTPDILYVNTRVTAGATEAVETSGGGYGNIARYLVNTGEMNGDAYKDLIFNSCAAAYSCATNYIWVYYGKAVGAWSSTIPLTVAGTFDGTSGFVFDLSTVPAWFSGLTSLNIKMVVSDINGDGKTDIILSDIAADPDSVTNSGASFVLLQPSAGWSSIWTGGVLSFFGQAFDATTGLPLNNDATKAYRIDGASTSDSSAVLGAADINNDGKNDLIIGAYGRNTNAGSVYILFGRNTLPWEPTTNLGLLH